MSEEIRRAVKTTVTLARDVWERAKIEAVRQGLTLTQVVEAALRKYLELAEEKRKKESKE